MNYLAPMLFCLLMIFLIIGLWFSASGIIEFPEASISTENLTPTIDNFLKELKILSLEKKKDLMEALNQLKFDLPVLP